MAGFDLSADRSGKSTSNAAPVKETGSYGEGDKHRVNEKTSNINDEHHPSGHGER